jgi:uncharacterized protein YndB with AHSA1/START domain
MLKWIASGCLVIILIVCVVAYAGYRKMQSIAANGPAVTVSFGATPERVFAAMSHTDSLAAWFAPGMSMHTARKGTLVAGDTIFLTQQRRDSVARTAWVIDTVVPNRLIAMRWVILQGGMVVHRRRDSLTVAGDSTRVTSTIVPAMIDSISAARTRANGASGGLIDMAATMGTAGARIQAEQELRRLKLHIEGVSPISRP